MSERIHFLTSEGRDKLEKETTDGILFGVEAIEVRRVIW